MEEQKPRRLHLLKPRETGKVNGTACGRYYGQMTMNMFKSTRDLDRFLAHENPCPRCLEWANENQPIEDE